MYEHKIQYNVTQSNAINSTLSRFQLQKNICIGYGVPFTAKWCLNLVVSLKKREKN